MASTYAQQVGLVRWAPKGWEWPTNCRDCGNDEVVLWLLLHSTQGETHGADRHDCISRSSRPDSYYCYIDREEEGDRFELRRESLDRGGRHFVSFFFFVFQAAFLISVHFENLSKCFVRFRVFFLINLGALNGSRGLEKIQEFYSSQQQQLVFLWKQKFRRNLFNRV